MWVLFEESSFVPCAKIKNGKTYSIITDHLGTPTQIYNAEGESVWEQELDMYGKVRKFANKDYVHLPFRYQGQYFDKEIDLCYNRFRYYDPETGRYISEDPIGFLSGEFNLYNYVNDPNTWLDILGLASYSPKGAKEKVRRGQGPDEISRIDLPSSSVPGSQWHAHGKGENKGGLNIDGTIKDSDPNFSKKTKKWLRQHGWNV